MEFQPSQHSYSGPLVIASVTGVSALALLAGIAALPTFVITPLILKAFVPEWSYGRRLIGGIGVTMAAGFTYKIAKAVGGEE